METVDEKSRLKCFMHRRRPRLKAIPLTKG